MDDAAELVRTKAAEPGLKYNVPASIHPDDLLFRFFETMHQENAADHYFSSGHGDAQLIGYTMKELLPTLERPEVLEFASGFGRVSRHLRNAPVEMDVTVSDIHPAAVAFAQSAFGMKAVASAARHDDLMIDREFDFIFALSFFSHMPDALFADWIAKLYSALKKGGVLLFSTHGETSMRKYPFLRQFYDDKGGHGYNCDIASDQPDIQGENYGTAVSDFHYVARQIKKSGAGIIRFTAGRWWGHQDEWVLRKTD